MKPSNTPKTGWRRRILRVFVVICLIFAFYSSWMIISGWSALSDAIEETEQSDPRWRLVDMLADQRAIPNESNSALILIKAYALVDQTDRPAQFDAEEIVLPNAILYNHRPNERQKEAMSVLMKAYEKAMPEYIKIATLPLGRYPFTWTPTVNTSQTSPFAREAARCLRVHLLNQLEAGDFAAADQTMRAMVNVAPSFGDEPVAISILVRCAVRSVCNGTIRIWLSLSSPDQNVILSVQQELEKEALVPLLTMYARAERATGFEMFELLLAPPAPPANPVESIQNLLRRNLGDFGFLSRQKAAHLQFMNQVVAIMSKPHEVQLDELAKCGQQVNQFAILVRLLIPAITKVTQAIHRSIADLQCTITALAAERFRIHNHRWPETLNELVAAGLLKSMPVDPFDGQPLRYKITDNGRLIYSIGQDRMDNGGAFDPEKPTDPGNDIIFRLNDPTHRRLPPVPVKPKEKDPEVP